MATPREIITLQVGHYANFVGTHCWNMQDNTLNRYVNDKHGHVSSLEIASDVYFRRGQTLSGEDTYTPRLVIVDLKGSLNSLKQDGTLYNVSRKENTLWNDDVDIHKSEQPAKNEFLTDLERQEEQFLKGKNPELSQEKDMDETEMFGASKLYDLDDSVRVWSDFLQPHLHPKTVHLLLADHNHPSSESFDVFGVGQQVMSNVDNFDELENKLRFFAEECDNLQGFKLLLDLDNAFSGAADTMLQYLNDDFSGKTILACGTIPSFPSQTPQQYMYKMLNTALAMSSLSEYSNLHIPLSVSQQLGLRQPTCHILPNVTYKQELDYHSSAVLALAWETATSPLQLASDPLLLWQLADTISQNGRKLCCLQAGLPFPLHDSSTLAETLSSRGKAIAWTRLTPTWPTSHQITTHQVFSQSVVVCGIPQDRIKSQQNVVSKDLKGCKTALDVVKLYDSETFPTTRSLVHAIREPRNVQSPFPHIFSPSITQQGQISSDSYERSASQGVETIPTATCLQSSSAAGNLLAGLHKSIQNINIRKYHKLTESGFEAEELQEKLLMLQNISEQYNASNT